MTKKIFEELPARKHAPVATPAAQDRDGAKPKEGVEGSEKRVRQAVYDIRYRARREGIDLRAAYAQYMQNSNLSAPEQAAVRAKLFAKDGGENRKESYTPLMSEGASGAVATAMFKVFVEQPDTTFEDSYEQNIEEEAERKYKVRVTDPKNDRSYVRYATREKITQLRQKGLKVEMTEHGEPYEGERKKRGELDPVAKNPARRDGDVNNDGKKDKTDSYIYNRRDAINAAIARKKAMREDFLVDGTTSTEGQNRGKITGANVDNYSTGIVTVNPESKVDQGRNGKMRRGIYAHTEVEGEMISEKSVSRAQQRFMGMVHAVKKGEMEAPSKEVADAAKSMSKKEAKDFASTKHDKLPEKKEMKEEMDKCPKCGKCPCECDNRAEKTYRDLLKNKLRSMGIKNPIILNAPKDEKDVMKIMTSSSAKMNENVVGGPSLPGEKGKKVYPKGSKMPGPTGATLPRV